MADRTSYSATASGKKLILTPIRRPRRRIPFWKHQPVVHSIYGTTLTDNHIRSPNSITYFLRGSSRKLPYEFDWVSINVNIDRILSRLEGFIRRHYLNDKDIEDNGVLDFSYSRASLRWLLRAPGSINFLHVAIRDKSTKKIAGFIAGTPATIRIKTEIHRVAIANLLCVHKNRRSERLAPVLINELARRATVDGIWQGVFATDVHVPSPLCSCEWLQRYLNPRKLREIGFDVNMSKKRKRNDGEILFLTPEPETLGFRKMRRRDINAVAHLLNEHLKIFTVAPVVDKDFVDHFLLPKHGVVDSYVVEDPMTLEITDFCSFVIQKREIRKKRRWWVLKCAVLFYYVATKTELLSLIRDLVVTARMNEFDIFRAQGIMGNDLFLYKLRFEAVRDKKMLHYHFYNYGITNLVMPQEFGLIIL